MPRSFFDTNVLVYLFDGDAPAKRKKARQLLEQEFEAGRAVLSTQVLQEFYVSITRKLAEPVPPDLAERAVRDLATLPLMLIDGPLVLAAVARSGAARWSLWDALIVEAALASGADRLFTEDLKSGQKVNGLEIVNPF
ncbi:MAG: PIN domain-containing protein [Gemmatimonadota bacterium]